jgi:hypothetical protein
MNFCIDAISASVGKRLVGLSVQMLMKRMSILLGMISPVTVFGRAGFLAFTIQSNGWSGIRQIVQRIFRPGWPCLNRQQDLNSSSYYGE